MGTDYDSAEGQGTDWKLHTFVSWREASTPGFRLPKPLKTPTLNSFVLQTGRPKASKRKMSTWTSFTLVTW
jgi:hypothetical protein